MKKYILQTVIMISSVLLSIFYYPSLPERMASHWNAQSIVDSYSSKLSNVLAFPAILIAIFVLLLLVPKIDPKKKNIEKFEKKFYLFVSSILFFFLLVQLQVFLWNTGIQLSMAITMPILMGGLWFVVAELLKDAKQNYTIGIRTPWTLASENNWNKTHKLGVLLFRIAGVISLASILVPSYSFYFVIGTVLIAVIILSIYSYLEFKKES